MTAVDPRSDVTEPAETRSAGGLVPFAASGGLLVEEPIPGVARLIVSNPRKRGALDAGIIGQLVDAFTSLDARCVVLTGEGTVFSAGCDLTHFRSAPPDAAERLVSDQFEPVLELISAYPYPTIAAINGHAVGAGLELALACDLRIGADSARMSMPPGKLGLVYSRAGVRRFVETIGVARTRELFLVGGQIDAATGSEWGLLNRVVGAEQISKVALSLASEIAANAPLAQAGNKRVIGMAAGPNTAADEAELQKLRTASFHSEDFREGLRAFVERREPRWSGR